MAIYLMDKTYRITTSGGVPSARVVVAGTGSGQCQLPAAADASKILGITITSQPELGRGVSVRKAGIAAAVAAGPISPGAPLSIADSTGRVKEASGAAGTTVPVVGFAETSTSSAGQLVDVFLCIHTHTI